MTTYLHPRHTLHALPTLRRAAHRLMAMVMMTMLLLALALALAAPARAQNISTVAGNGGMGFSGDGGPATAAQMNWPFGLALDGAGNLYVADNNNHRIRKVDATNGTISTVVGNGRGFGGDGDPASTAQLNLPYSVATDAAGNLYITDSFNHRIRKVSAANGIITTVAGDGAAGFGGDGGPATAAQLNYPYGVAVDAAGNLYIADTNNHRIRKVSAADGTISTLAGNGTGGFGGDGAYAPFAQLNSPYGVAVDAAGNVYIADLGNHRIRRVSPQIAISTVAGGGTQGLGDNGPATAAQLNSPSSVAVGTGGVLYIADMGSGRIRKVSAAGTISTVAGNGTAGFSGDNGPATAAQLNLPSVVAVNAADGTLYFTDRENRRIRKVANAAPDAPTAANAVAGNAQATVSWTAPANTGGPAITGYTATAVEDTTKTCTPVPATATSCTVATLANGTPYTFTVVASNTVGPSVASAPSTAVTPLGVPGAPTAVTAVAGNGQATVSWAAPVATGGGPLTSYTVTGTPAGTCTVAPPATSCTVPTLTNGTGYTFTVVAHNALWPSLASAPSTAVKPVADDPGPVTQPVTTPGGNPTITDPTLPIVIGPGAGGATLVVPGSGSMPVPLSVTLNGQPIQVQATPGTQLRVAQVNGQSVLVLVVLQGWASMTSTAEGQPLALAGEVLLSAGRAGTTIEAQPFAVAVLTGALLPPQGSLPQLGRMGLQAGERLQVNEQGAVVSITLGSLAGNTSQPGDPMVFANLPAAITVDSKVFARLAGPLARLSGVNLAQGLEATASGVLLMRDGGQLFQLLPTLPITIDATLPDGLSFTPLGLLRWVRGGVVVQFAPAVADLAGLANAITAVLPGAQIRLGAEGVVQLRTGGRTYVLKPGWTGAGSATGTPQIGVDEQGRIYLQTGNGPRQWLLPALLNATQAQAVFQTALPGATLAVQPQANDGGFTVTLAGQSWRLVPQWLLPEGAAAQVPAPSANWWMGADGLLYLKLGSLVQGVRAVD